MTHQRTSHKCAHKGDLIDPINRPPMAEFACRQLASSHHALTSWRTFRLFVTAITLCSAWSRNAFGQEPTDLVRAIVSRSAAIASGRIAYSFKSESSVGDRTLSPVILPEVTTSFANSSWAERTKGSHKVRINHDGYFLEFVQTPQRDGSVRPGATLYPQRSLASRKELNAPPIFAGSFWHPEQLRFLEQHANECQLVGSSVVNGIPVMILETWVAAENHRKAFHLLLPSLKSGGTVRLYVAAQLGFVLPRIEFLTPSRQVAQSYDAIDFTEVAPGIFFPSRVWTETHAAGGESRYRGEFSIRCEYINQSVPEEDFVVTMPVGTHIQDAHEPGSVINFELAAASSSEKLPTFGSASPTTVGFLDRWRNSVIVGIVIGTIFSIGFLLAARRQRYCA